MKDDKLYLIHVQECIERVMRYTTEGKEFFFADAKTQDAVIEINWRNIAGFRNVAVHDYLGLDLKQIWEIVENDLPVLKDQIAAVLKELGGISH